MKHLILLGSLCLFLIPLAADAHHQEPAHIRILETNQEIDLPIANEGGGVSLEVKDLGNDGTPEIIVGNGLGSEPRVRVLRLDGSEVGSFLAYAPNMGVGVNLAVCDLTGDGFNEIAVAPARGGGPHIRIFNRFGKPIDGGGFFAYNTLFRGGVNLACGDLIGSEQEELVTLPATGGGSHVRVWSISKTQSPNLVEEFFALDANDRSGVVATVDDKHLVVSQQYTSTPNIKLFSFSNGVSLVENKKLFLDTTGITSVYVANKKRYVSTATGDIFSVDENKKTNVASESVVIAVAKNKDGVEETFVANGKRLFDANATTRILVDTNKQRLYAYQKGVLDNTFLISSGRGNATPLGKHDILAKIPEVHYKWTYGPDDPRNYDLGLVPYNLRFYPHIYLHYAPWHNNFGHKMSRGCVNVNLTNMKWLYDWAEEGIEVEVL